MMDNKQQDANNSPAVRIEAKDRSPTDIWVLCKSKSYPGLSYYFNKATGEAMWSMDFEKHKEKKTACDMFKRSIEFSHNYPEPQLPPFKSQYSIDSSSSSHVYNKQIINNKFSRNPYPWSTFGNVSFPNYLAHPIPNQFAYNFPEVQYNQNSWAIPANQPVFVGPAVSIPNENHSFNLCHNDHIAVQKTSVSLSDRFKNLGSGADQVSRKIEIPKIDKTNPRFGKNFRHKPEISTRNMNGEDASNQLHYNDLRLMLEAKRRKSIDVPEVKNDSEEIDVEYNKIDGLEENPENITMKMTGLKVSNPISSDVSSSSLPFKKKVTFDSLDIKDIINNTVEEELNLENMCEDDMDFHGALPQIDVTLLKRLSKPNDRNDLWFIVVDTCVLLSNLFFVNMLVKSDNKCRMMIPYRVHDELESQCSDMFRNHSLRTVGMAQRARRYISKELNARTCMVAQTAIEAEDRNINCPKEDDDILNCCLQLASQNYHVILLTNDENLIIKSRICGIQSFTVKNMKKYLSGKEPERTFLPAPLKITIENDRKGDTVFKHSNFLINNTRLNTKSNIHETDNSENSVWQNKFNFGKIPTPQKRDILQHVSSNKSQDTECQTSDIIQETLVKKTDLFMNKSNLNQDFRYKSDSKNCDQTINYNSLCIRNRSPQHLDIKKINNIENNIQNKTYPQTKMDLCSERVAYTQNVIPTKINNNTDNYITVNASDVQKNKKREIHLKRSNSNALNDATTICIKKRPFKWRRKNIIANKNISKESNNITTKPKNSLAKSVVSELSQNKYSSQDLDINKACEPNVQKCYKSNDNSVNDNSYLQSENTEEQESNDLEETITSVSTYMPQKVMNYVSESVNATDMNRIVLHKTQSSNVTKSNDIRKKAVNEWLRYKIDGKNNDITKERFSFNITDKTIEEKFKMGCDEWLSRYVQIMEEVLTQILQQNPSTTENKLLPPPWTLHEAAQCIKMKYKSNTSITTSADQLSFLLLEISDKIGKISSSLNPEQFMTLFNYGFNLVEALNVVHTNCEDITVAKASLYKLLNDIKDHNSHRFDTEMTMGLEDMLNENTFNRSTIKDVNQINENFSSITSNNLSSTDEKMKSPMKVRNSDQEIWKATNVLQTPSKKLINNKDTNDIVFDNNCVRLPNVTTTITSNDNTVKDQLKASNLKRTINVYDKDNANNSAPSEYVVPIEKTQMEALNVQPKIIRNFTGIPDFEKRLSEKKKSAFRLDNLGYAKLNDLCYDLDEEDGYLDEEYENEFPDDFTTDDHDPLYDVSKDLNLDREVNEECGKQTNHTHQLDAPLFKKPMDVNKEYEKVKEHRNIEIVIKTFLREIKETFLQVHTYCQEILKEMKQTGTLTLHRKQEIYKQTENTHNHLNNITSYLKTILQRDIDDADKNVQSSIHKVISKNLSLEGEENLVYREIIAKCLGQASILSEVLTDILNLNVLWI